jgi:hypothetical protein
LSKARVKFPPSKPVPRNAIIGQIYRILGRTRMANRAATIGGEYILQFLNIIPKRLYNSDIFTFFVGKSSP